MDEGLELIFDKLKGIFVSPSTLYLKTIKPNIKNKDIIIISIILK